MNLKFRKATDEIFKLIYRLSHSKRYKHNRKRWPHVKITRGQFGQITYFSYRGNNFPIVDLISLKNSFSGELIIIASGPSVNQINFTKSSTVTTLGVNGSYHLKGTVNFNLYIITDIHFFSQRSDIVKQIISDNQLLLFVQVDGLVKLIDQFGKTNILCKIALIEDAFKLTYGPIRTITELENDKNRNKSIYFYHNNYINHEPIAFETNILQGIFPAKTVVYWALQIVAFLGFKTIYLAGVDMNNFSSPRFYETTDNITYSQLELDFEKNILPAFEHASSVLKKLDISVINMSLNSALSTNIFEKKSYDEIFSKLI